MVRFNEALLVGISLLAALVFSKGRGSAPSLPTLPLNNSNTDLLSKTQAQTIGKEILDYEKNITNTQIDYLQTELSKTQSFITQQQKIANPPQLKIGNKGVISQDQSYWSSQLGGLKKYAEAIIFGNAAGTNLVRGKNIRDGRYIDSQGLREAYDKLLSKEKIEAANELVFRQQGEIDRLQEEYQTRYGNLSRYG